MDYTSLVQVTPDGDEKEVTTRGGRAFTQLVLWYQSWFAWLKQQLENGWRLDGARVRPVVYEKLEECGLWYVPGAAGGIQVCFGLLNCGKLLSADGALQYLSEQLHKVSVAMSRCHV